MSKTLPHFISQSRPEIESALYKYLPFSHQKGTRRFNDALEYALFPGGKRWRPVLTLLGGMLVGATPENLLPAACAIEYLHTSSMIIDDLPAMDDSDLRRGKPSLHLAYDESTAMLVSLGLMNHSYSLLALTCQKSGHQEKAGHLIDQATKLIGVDGMIGGQVVDLELCESSLGDEILESRNLKTTALMNLMMTTGAIATNACQKAIAALSKYGECLGIAYQICDDLLDEVGEMRTLGKPLKQDERHRRLNYVSIYGITGAQRMATQLINEGVESLQSQFGNRNEVRWLREAAEMIVSLSSLSRLPNKYELAIV